MTTVAFLGVAHIHTPGFVRRIQARDDVQVTCGTTSASAPKSTRTKWAQR
jgi:hypothetical protein